MPRSAHSITMLATALTLLAVTSIGEPCLAEPAPSAARLEDTWGVLAKLGGRTFSFRVANGQVEDVDYRFHWAEYGKLMSVSSHPVKGLTRGGHAIQRLFYLDKKAGKVFYSGENTEKREALFDGNKVTIDFGPARQSYEATPDNRLIVLTEYIRDGSYITRGRLVSLKHGFSLGISSDIASSTSSTEQVPTATAAIKPIDASSPIADASAKPSFVPSSEILQAWGLLGRLAGSYWKFTRRAIDPYYNSLDSFTEHFEFRWESGGEKMSWISFDKLGNISSAYVLQLVETGQVVGTDLGGGQSRTITFSENGFDVLYADGSIYQFVAGSSENAFIFHPKGRPGPDDEFRAYRETGAEFASNVSDEKRWDAETQERRRKRERQAKKDRRSGDFANAMGAIAGVLGGSSSYDTPAPSIWEPTGPASRALQAKLAEIRAETAAKEQASLAAQRESSAEASRQRLAARQGTASSPQVSVTTDLPSLAVQPAVRAPARIATVAPPKTEAAPTKTAVIEAVETPVEWREGIVLCSAPAAGKGSAWRCQGPLQVTYASLDKGSPGGDLGNACGTSYSSMRDLGTVSGFRAFGCGFGIHPTDRAYPGNGDVPGRNGVGVVPGQLTFHCLPSKNAYCKTP